MNNTLRFELRKLFRQKTFYVCAAVVLLVEIINILTLFLIEKISTGAFLGEFSLGPSAAYYDGGKFLLMGSSFSQMNIVFPIFITLFVCNDFSEGTIKNILSRGISRGQVFFSKLLTVYVASLFFVLFGMLVAVITGTCIWGFGDSFELSFLPNLGVQFLLVLAYATVDVFFAFLFGKKAASLAVGIGLTTVATLVFALLDVILSEKVGFEFSTFLITGSLSAISNTSVSTSELVRAFFTAIAYIGVLGGAGWLVFKKREV